jgi:hypothetical protein
MFIPVFVTGHAAYIEIILVPNNTLIIAVLAVALKKIKKLLNEMPQAA